MRKRLLIPLFTATMVAFGCATMPVKTASLPWANVDELLAEAVNVEGGDRNPMCRGLARVHAEHEGQTWLVVASQDGERFVALRFKGIEADLVLLGRQKGRVLTVVQQLDRVDEAKLDGWICPQV